MEEEEEISLLFLYTRLGNTTLIKATFRSTNISSKDLRATVYYEHCNNCTDWQSWTRGYILISMKINE